MIGGTWQSFDLQLTNEIERAHPRELGGVGLLNSRGHPDHEQRSVHDGSLVAVEEEAVEETARAGQVLLAVARVDDKDAAMRFGEEGAPRLQQLPPIAVEGAKVDFLGQDAKAQPAADAQRARVQRGSGQGAGLVPQHRIEKCLGRGPQPGSKDRDAIHLVIAMRGRGKDLRHLVPLDLQLVLRENLLCKAPTPVRGGAADRGFD